MNSVRRVTLELRRRVGHRWTPVPLAYGLDETPRVWVMVRAAAAKKETP